MHSLLVAVFSGIITTILFYKATELSDARMLAVVESIHSDEVIFTLLGGVFIFHDKIPRLI
ncbi:multidrug resistance efflux transporter family protein [Clostridium estertheticum]|uniref:multidrug resistance efflux transporter family protein n=1 Tax=Clostridium estertheticum TaxID=238834 RepID=UPI00281565A1|nr:multidrug resistance efflux transporter family protein [Clostridium estertheticum]